MAKMKFTERGVARLDAPDPSGKQRLYWDQDLTGFGVLVSGATDTKTYVVQRDVGGRSRRVTVGATNVFTLEEAREHAKLILADLYRGLDPKAKPVRVPTVGEALDSYLGGAKNLREKTHILYRQAVDAYLADWRDVPMDQISAEMIDDRHHEIQQEVAKRARTRLATGKSTANITMRVLRTLYNHARAKHKGVTENPVSAATGFRGDWWYKEPIRDGVVKDAELPRFVEAVMALENSIHRDFLILCLFTGFRRSEACALKWDHVDFEERSIRVPASGTKTGKKLAVPMSDHVYALMMARREVGIDPAGWVFPANSKSGHLAEPRAALDRIAEQTGIRVTPHDLRRTYATVAESSDIPYAALKALLNHAPPRDITGGYTKITVERLRSPQQRVTDKMLELIGI